jgi:hypothetical protein
MNARLEKLKQRLEEAGGYVWISEDAPDDVAEIFARVVADCPLCTAAMAAASKRKNEREEN